MRFIKTIISQMTLEEKVGMCSGADFWRLKSVEHLGIPTVMVSDGPHGLRKQSDEADFSDINNSIKAVCFPTGATTACSFDRNLLKTLGCALGEECQAENVAVLLGPAINIKRSPLCGRNFEYFSEDPYVTGEMAASHITGVQSQHVGTSLKHFACNNQESYRMTASAEVDERTLREIYLPGFERAVKSARPWTVMTSYNRLNGEFTSESHYLLTDILRNEWGFDGYVMSDWGAVNNRVKGLKAGMDLEMPGSNGTNDQLLLQAVKDGTLSEEVLNKSVERILRKIFEFVDNRKPVIFDKEEHHRLARHIATESAVLLKNDDVLPLKATDTKIAFIGAFAKEPRYQGGGSSHINAFKVSSALDAVEGMDHIHFAQGFVTDVDETREELLNEAIELAKSSEVAVIFAGLPDSSESEFYDRTHMKLPNCQNELIKQVAAVQPNTVVVLHNGSPVEMPWVDEVPAILEMYLGGQAVGEATVDLLFGVVNPSGKLAETFPIRLEDNPSYLSYKVVDNKIYYDEKVFVSFELVKHNTSCGRVQLSVTGDHNVSNALAAIATAELLGIPMDTIRKGLLSFSGTDRRFEYKGTFNGVTVVDDYAHHPTEIAATLKAAQHYPHNEIWCVFQPHTYTRTKAFFHEFAEALSHTDHLVLADIYAARETDTLGISSSDLAKEAAKLGTDTHYYPSFAEIEAFLKENCKSGDLLITMGAGDVVKIGEDILK